MNNLVDYKTYIEMADSDYLEALIVKFQGNQTAMAEFSGMNRGTLRTKLKKLGLIRYTNGFNSGNWSQLIPKPKPEPMGNTGLIPMMDVKRDQIDWVDESEFEARTGRPAKEVEADILELKELMNDAAKDAKDKLDEPKSTMQPSFHWHPIRKGKSMQLTDLLDGMNVKIQSPSNITASEIIQRKLDAESKITSTANLEPINDLVDRMIDVAKEDRQSQSQKTLRALLRKEPHKIRGD